MIKIKTKNGYTLLFSVLVATVVMGVAVFILSVSRKQFILASTARESTYSVYAADSGIECASALSSITHESKTNGTADINCSGVINSGGALLGPTYAPDPASYVTSSGFASWSYPYILTSNGGCFKLKFLFYENYNSTGIPATVVESRGYNVCEYNDFLWGETRPVYASPRIVERALQLTYSGTW